VDWGGVSARSSDTPARRFTISENFNLLPGAVAFNLSGEIIGVVDASSNGKSFIPFEHLSGAFKSVLGGSEKINRAALGVRFVDLARAVGLQDARSRFLRSGALVAGSPAVKWGSAAHTAGILAGDIILAIDGVNIDADRSLDDLVATYSPGDKARVLVDRDSEHLDLDVTFGTAFE
jgi:S1-C subfamily serine protease